MIRPSLQRLLLLAALMDVLAGIQLQAAEPVPISLYDPDPNHLWNRLYSALMVRAPEADAAVNDLLDPPFWSDTRHLLDDGTYGRAVALLGELVEGQTSPDSMIAMHRAVMQRDLLAVFHWIANRGKNSKEFEQWTGTQRELAGALASAIRAVALTGEQIRKLPDNYAAAVATPGARTVFDPEHPEPFLPKDLMADDGSWIALAPQGDDGMAATLHFAFFNGRSAFEVRLYHPDGRGAGEAYLKQLAEMPQPTVYQKPDDLFRYLPNSDPVRGPWPNPSTPQFPPGTAWALVRRAILIDAGGAPVVSPLVESVQIRVYRSLERSLESLFFFEWETRHSLLLANGGFHLTTPADQVYSSFLSDGDHVQRPLQEQATLNCVQCHSAEGIHAVQSRVRLFEEQLSRPPEFHAENRARLDELTIFRIRALPGWMLLRWLWDDARP